MNALTRSQSAPNLSSAYKSSAAHVPNHAPTTTEHLPGDVIVRGGNPHGSGHHAAYHMMTAKAERLRSQGRHAEANQVIRDRDKSSLIGAGAGVAILAKLLLLF